MMIACIAFAFSFPRLTLRAWRKMPLSPLLAHKASVMQAKPMIFKVKTHALLRYSSFDEVERPVHFRNFDLRGSCLSP